MPRPKRIRRGSDLPQSKLEEQDVRLIRELVAERERHKSNIEFSHACVDQGIDIAVEERSNLIWLARLSDDARDSVWRMCAEAMNITSLRNSARKRLGADFGLQSSEADAKAVLHPVQDAPSSEETTETEETQAETKETDHPAPAESTVVEEDPRVKTVDDWFGPPLQSSGNRPGPRLCDMQGELLDVLYSMVTDPRAPKTNKNRHRKFSARVLFPKLAATGKLPPMTTTKVAWDDPEAGAKIAALLPDIWRLVEAKPKNPEQWWARNVRNRPSIAEAAASPQPEHRPRDMDILHTLAVHYRVHEMVALGWLLDMDLQAAERELAKEFAT